MGKGMLIDLTRCLGCRGCQVACKQWNDLPAEATSIGTEFTNPQERSAYTWTLVEFHTVAYKGKTVSTFTKTGCLHCEHPACASICIAGAIKKTAGGPVVIDTDKCIGCRYCLVACPVQVPRYEYDKVVPRVRKCTMCADRQAEGLQPACASTCPTGALLFGDRAELLALARKRIKADPTRYVDHIYGEHELGGTAVIYLSGVPLELTALDPNVTLEAIPDFTWKAMRQLPALLGLVGISSLGLLAYSNRRNAIAEAAAAKEGGKSND